MPDVTILLPMAALLLLIGAFAGILAGLLGVGGGLVLVPAFFYAFSALGHDSPDLMRICLATSLATIIFTSLRSVTAHNRKGAVDRDILKTWAPGIMAGAFTGALVVLVLRSAVLQGLFGLLGICIALYMTFARAHWRIGPRMPAGVTRAGLSAATGFLSVLMGIGGGSFGVPLMTLYGRPIHQAVATASGFGALIAAPSLIGFLAYQPDLAPPFTVGVVNLPAFALVVVATWLTAPFGARLAHMLDPLRLRRIFALFLTLVALNMLREALGW